jgi:hypothetical protein
MQDTEIDIGLVEAQLHLIAKVGWRIHETQTGVKWQNFGREVDVFKCSLQASGLVLTSRGGCPRLAASAHEQLSFAKDDQSASQAVTSLRSEFRKHIFFDHDFCTLQVLLSSKRTPSPRLKLKVDELWLATEFAPIDQIMNRIRDVLLTLPTDPNVSSLPAARRSIA